MWEAGRSAGWYAGGMAIEELSVEGYRSIRHVYLRLGRVNVLVGANGCGKTNLYRSMYLLHMAARGGLGRALAEEGGMPSALWAGEMRRNEERRIGLHVRVGDYSFHLECGMAAPVPPSRFNLDPQVKEERVVLHEGKRKVDILTRQDMSMTARNDEGVRESYPLTVMESESVLSELREPHRFPELSMLRQELLGWRFYHHFRTDAGSPLREGQVATRTPVLGHDGGCMSVLVSVQVDMMRLRLRR